MLFSVHLPKTAGTSFRIALQEQFGDQLIFDGADFPANAPPAERNRHALRSCLLNSERELPNVKCIHGHYLPLKYLDVNGETNHVFVTWLREPVDRLISHYHFWHRIWDPVTAQRVHRRMIEEKWSFEEFCFRPEMRNLYQQFLWGFSLDRFDFVGVTEHFESDLAYFSERFLDRKATARRDNVGDYRSKVPPISSGLRARIEEHHAADVALYRTACMMRERMPGRVVKRAA